MLVSRSVDENMVTESCPKGPLLPEYSLFWLFFFVVVAVLLFLVVEEMASVVHACFQKTICHAQCPPSEVLAQFPDHLRVSLISPKAEVWWFHSWGHLTTRLLLDIISHVWVKCKYMVTYGQWSQSDINHKSK